MNFNRRHTFLVYSNQSSRVPFSLISQVEAVSRFEAVQAVAKAYGISFLHLDAQFANDNRTSALKEKGLASMAVIDFIRGHKGLI